MLRSALQPSVADHFDALNAAKLAIDAEIAGMLAMKDSLGFEFVRAIKAIAGIKGRAVICGVGKSGHVAKKVAATFSSTGTPAIFVHASEASHGDLGMITENDIVLVFSNSGESAELTNIVEYCKRFGISIIGIARKERSFLINASEIKLVLPNVPEASSIDAPTTSTTMMMALGDATAVVLHDSKGFSKDDFKVFHPGGNIGAKLLKVTDLMHSGEEVPLVDEEASSLSAIVEMSKKRMGCVGVTNNIGELIGVFTDGDLRRHIDCDFKSHKIREVMTENPKTTSPNLFASEALKIMNSKSITALFVLVDNKPIGIIHLHDILRAKVV